MYEAMRSCYKGHSFQVDQVVPVYSLLHEFLKVTLNSFCYSTGQHLMGAKRWSYPTYQTAECHIFVTTLLDFSENIYYNY